MKEDNCEYYISKTGSKLSRKIPFLRTVIRFKNQDFSLEDVYNAVHHPGERNTWDEAIKDYRVVQ